MARRWLGRVGEQRPSAAAPAVLRTHRRRPAADGSDARRGPPRRKIPVADAEARMMSELFDAVLSWPTFVAVLFVFGFAPGAVLRLIVLAFHHDDPRRRELIAE